MFCLKRRELRAHWTQTWNSAGGCLEWRQGLGSRAENIEVPILKLHLPVRPCQADGKDDSFHLTNKDNKSQGSSCFLSNVR